MCSRRMRKWNARYVPNYDDSFTHCEPGYLLLRQYLPFEEIAHIVRMHHVRWRDGAETTYLGKSVPLESHIIHLADRAAVLIDPSVPVLAGADQRSYRSRESAQAGQDHAQARADRRCRSGAPGFGGPEQPVAARDREAPQHQGAGALLVFQELTSNLSAHPISSGMSDPTPMLTSMNVLRGRIGAT